LALVLDRTVGLGAFVGVFVGASKADTVVVGADVLDGGFVIVG